MSFLCIHIIRLCPHLPWYGSIMLASRHKHLNMWMSVSQSVQPQTQGEKFFFIHDHEPCNYSIKGQEGVWLCHLGFWPFSSEKYDLPGLPCVRDGRGARSEDYRWCSPVGFVKQWSSAHALVLHNWVGNIQDEVVAPSWKSMDHRLQVGEASYFKIFLVSVDTQGGHAGEIKNHLTSEQLASPRGAGGGSGYPTPRTWAWRSRDKQMAGSVHISNCLFSSSLFSLSLFLLHPLYLPFYFRSCSLVFVPSTSSPPSCALWPRPCAACRWSPLRCCRWWVRLKKSSL